MGLIEELATRLDRVEAELALHRLVNDYCIGADHRDLTRWQQVWTPDAVWQTSPTGVPGDRGDHRRGHRAVAGVPDHAALDGQPRGRGGGRDATGHCDVIVQIQLGDGRWLVGGGAYEDEYRREAGSWRIARRTVSRPFDLPPIPADDPSGATAAG
jgi:hypothetical protein